MIDALMQIAVFAVKAVIVFAVIAALLLLVSVLIRRERGYRLGRVRIHDLNDHYDLMRHSLRQFVEPKKSEKTKPKKPKEPPPKVYVLEFVGDIMASQVTDLRELITSLLPILEPRDEVVVLLESYGGVMQDYGLAAAQLQRLRDHEVQLTICVDKVAASGGYLMACVGERIMASPFASIGSIGVLVQMPNFHRLLSRWQVDYLELSAGEHKRSISPFGEVTEENVAKVNQDLVEAHDLFKHFIAKFRPDLDLEKVATGDDWYGSQAKDLGLIDVLGTSDDYLMKRGEAADVFLLEYEAPRSVKERFAGIFSEAADKVALRWWDRLGRSERAKW